MTAQAGRRARRRGCHIARKGDLKWLDLQNEVRGGYGIHANV